MLQIIEESACPVGACVGCASSALAAQEFRLFVRNSEKLWYKALQNLTTIECDDPDNAKSLCAFIQPTDFTLVTTKDYSGGEPKAVVNRSNIVKKTKRKPRRHRTGPMSTCPDCKKEFTSPFFLHEHFKSNGPKSACITCGAVLARGADMKEHMKNVHKVTAFLCPKCPSLFTKSEEFNQHLKHAHKPGVYNCLECGRSFPRKSTFDHHAQMHVVRTCRKCVRQFTNRICYREHRMQCEPEAIVKKDTMPRNQRSNVRDLAVFICDYCDKHYSLRSGLQNHILWIHMNHKPHQCQWCGKRFFTLGRMTEHSVVHTRERNFECDICGAKLVSKMAAVYHRRRHTGEKPYKCEDCDLSFISSSRRLEHAKRKHHKGNRAHCELCPNTFARKTELKRHMEKVHSAVKPEKLQWNEPIMQPVQQV